MDSTLAAGVIGAGSAVIASALSMCGAMAVNKRAAAHATEMQKRQLGADAEMRAWDRRAESYTAIVAHVRHHNLMIEHQNRTYRLDDATEKYLAKQFEEDRPEGGYTVTRSRFAVTATVEAVEALERVDVSWTRFGTARKAFDAASPAPSTPAAHPRDLESAIREVHDATTALEERLRLDLVRRR